MSTLRRFAEDHDIPYNTRFNTDVLSVKGGAKEPFTTLVKDLTTGAQRIITSQFLCVTCGILSSQWKAEERGVEGMKHFKGVATLGGKDGGVDSAVATTDLRGKQVVILGSGSFAAEALEAAERSGADHITIVGRPRYRWILPFSRQYTISAMANAPLVPWSWKSKFALVSGILVSCILKNVK